MTSTFTPNKNLELPGYNDYVDSWNTPVNADFTAVDTALGGVTNLNATAVSGDVTLTSTQYRPFQIVVTGTLTANVRYLIPASVGGQWTVTNSTTGAFTVKIASAAGGSDITLPSGTTMVSCDGTATGMRLSITSTGVARVDSFSGGTTGLTPSTATTGAVTLAGTLGVSNGGTGLTAAPVSGQIPIGNGTGYTLAQLTAGSGVTITNGAGSVTIAATGGGTVTSVNVSGGSTGLTTSGGPVTTSGTITLAGTLGVGYGGTGVTTTPSNGQLLIGNGSGYTAATLTAGTNMTITNASGSITLAATSGQFQTQLFTASGTWTAPAGVTKARVTVIGGGGGGGTDPCGGGGGGDGGGVTALVTVTPGTAYTITIGTGGANGNPNGGAGTTSSFGSLATATGGTGAINSTNGTNGSGSTTGTANSLKSASYQNRGMFGGIRVPGNTAAQTWTTSNVYGAGLGGAGVSSGSSGGGVSGIVYIEWVG